LGTVRPATKSARYGTNREDAGDQPHNAGRSSSNAIEDQGSSIPHAGSNLITRVQNILKGSFSTEFLQANIQSGMGWRRLFEHKVEFTYQTSDMRSVFGICTA
jgi:hypothetical protein